MTLTPFAGRSLAILSVLFLLSACAQPDAPPEADPSAETASAATPASETPPEGPADEAESDSETLTVVFFGDSLTAGYGLPNPEEEAYPGLIADRLEAEGIEARVVNAGSSGETTAGGLRRVDWILSNNPPDVFVLALGGNDMLRGQPPEETEANLAATFEKVREVAPDARLVLAGMEALANYGEDYRETFRGVYRDVADRYDAAFIPFLLEGVGGVRELNQPDGVHPTAEGQQVMAETVWTTLAPLVGAS
ncbi:MAG: arylesterase [Bacteroidota bacterium]